MHWPRVAGVGWLGIVVGVECGCLGYTGLFGTVPTITPQGGGCHITKERNPLICTAATSYCHLFLPPIKVILAQDRIELPVS